MKRRTFVKTAGLLGATAATSNSSYGQQNPAGKGPYKILNAYYFRAHMYTMVPRQVREDLQWMRDNGTTTVSVAVLEQDFFAAVENIEIIISEAEKLGMDVFAVPSRWGGHFAGAPKVPSLFSVKNPQTWIIGENGKPVPSRVSGVFSSVHYPETMDFYHESIDKLFTIWDFKGVIWDEPKLFGIRDFSERAIAKLGRDQDVKVHANEFKNFLTAINQYSKTNFPDKRTCMFIPARYQDWQVEMAAQVEYLDDYGADGRPWYNKDGGQLEGPGKVLLGDDGGERHLAAAKKYGKNSLWLVENHNMAMADLPILEKRLPEVLSKPVDHMIYYYYPRNVEDPDKIMGVIAENLRRKLA